MDIEEKIAQLRKELTRHSRLYYVEAQPEISDSDYDRLYEQLLALEKAHPSLVTMDSPTQRIGAPPEGGFAKVEHTTRMLSLDKVVDADALFAFFEPGTSILVEPKIDGLSLKLIYRDRQLVQAITRGDGSTGDDVTVNARTIKTIPLAVPFSGDLEVVGEVFMAQSVFSAMNAELERTGAELMANARNAAAGSMKLKDPEEVMQRRLSFVGYGINNELEGLRTHKGVLEYLGKLGFRTTIHFAAFTTKFVTAADAKLAIAHGQKANQALDVGTDGLVMKMNELREQRERGVGTKFPKWAVAYKFPPEEKPTILMGVTIQVGKTGKVTPVAELAPVSLAGTVVKRASLCNQEEIDRLGVNIGDTVVVMKANEIIPKIVRLGSKKTDGVYTMPRTCPCCSSALVIAEDVVDWYCPNSDCDEQVLARLVHATGKYALDIDGCGEALVKVLMQHGVRSLVSLFSVPKEQLVIIKPAARKKFLEGREKAKGAALWRKLNALSIENIGQTNCQELAARWSSLEEMADKIDEVRKVLGNVATDSFIDYVSSNAKSFDELEELGFEFVEKRSKGPLSGKVFVITGNLVSGTRPEVMSRILEKGGLVKSSVSAKVHYLVKGSDAGNTKLNAAINNNVPIISEADLFALMGVKASLDTGAANDDEVKDY